MTAQETDALAQAILERVGASPVVSRAMALRARNGYTLHSRDVLYEEFGPNFVGVRIRFICQPGQIELPRSELVVVLYADTLDVFKLVDPHVPGTPIRIPEVVLNQESFSGALPFVLVVPLPRGFPIHENLSEASRRLHERWAAIRGISPDKLYGMEC